MPSHTRQPIGSLGVALLERQERLEERREKR